MSTQTQYKVLLIGITRAGKSTIIQRFSLGVNEGGKRFIQYMTDEGERYQLVVYDTPCLDESAANDKTYYENAQAVIFVGSYDLPESLTAFGELRAHLHKFIDPSSYIPYFAMNKCDIKGSKAKVTPEMVKKTKEELNVDHVYDISILEKIGVRALFELIANTLHDKYSKK
ncbi:hypothetical protein M9Y10_002834 [Tritrichomonas musculus]|uniref:Uncharacterized protein n=1 Tax=Tritrichomonas musculus TaxID=1915356 RepID=A0ABR2LBB4_9EUKA